MFLKRFPLLLTALVVLLASLILLTACSLEMDPEVCYYDTISRPIMISPAWDEITSTSPTFTWSYTDSECLASYFELYVSTDEMAVAGHTAPIYRVSGMSYTLSVSLLPATTYYWSVVPVINTTDGEVRGPGGEAVVPFNTGPECSLADARTLPTLLSPEDGAVITRTDGFGFYWDDPSACIPERYEVEISGTSDFADFDLFIGERRTSLGIYTWGDFAWSDCTEYFWRVRSLVEDAYAPYSGVWSFTIDTGTSVCSLGPGPIITRIPPIARLLQNANCRFGPSRDYPVRSVLMAGQEVEIQGRNRVGDAWLVFDPSLGDACWVYDALVEASGDLDLVSIVDPDPPSLTLPEDIPAPPVNCSQYAAPMVCQNNPACWWDPNDPPQSNGSCKNK